MPAYLIVTREEPLQDEAAMVEYQRRTRLLTNPLRLKPLVIYGDIVPLEGQSPDGVIVLQFESIDLAKSWYENPEYQEALAFRLKAAAHRAFIVDGI